MPRGVSEEVYASRDFGASVPRSIRKDDLEIAGVLGEGAFARVVHAQHKLDRTQEYALKIVDKRQIQQRGRRNSVLMEKSLLSSFDHDGIVKLYFAYQDDVSLYFVLELAAGGELAMQITSMGVCALPFTQFYVSEIVEILDYLRSRRVAHRDVKPENLLLTLEGRLKLIDFDAAVVVPADDPEDQQSDLAAGGPPGGSAAAFEGEEPPQQPSFAGTSLYLPPEVLQSTAKLSEGLALDLWALGCIVYQMLVGVTPFVADSEYLTFQRILQGDYEFPQKFDHGEARFLIEVLLSPEPGARPNPKKLRQHPFFGGAVGYAALRKQNPPARANHNRKLIPSSFTESIMSIECTPEEGMSFLDSSGVECVSHAASTVGFPPRLECESFSEPRLTIPTRKRSWGPGRAGSAGDITSADEAFGSSSTTASAHAARSRSAGPARAGSGGSLASDAGRLDRPGMEGLPFESWSHWLSELKLRQVLHCEENVRLWGSVVKRRLPCLRPRVLMLTDLPRLLILDPRGQQVMRDIDLTATVNTRSGSSSGPVVAVTSRYEFSLNVLGRRYRCSDTSRGSTEWASEIALAREKVLSWIVSPSSENISQRMGNRAPLITAPRNESEGSESPT